MDEYKMIIRNLSLQYADGNESLHHIYLNIPCHAITVLFGPAGGGKSSRLRCISRLNDLTDLKTISEEILLDGKISSIRAPT